MIFLFLICITEVKNNIDLLNQLFVTLSLTKTISQGITLLYKTEMDHGLFDTVIIDVGSYIISLFLK